MKSDSAKEHNLTLVLSIIALVLGGVAFLNSISIGEITGHATRTDVYYDDGYVGIGTDNPGVPLDVVGEVQFSDDLDVDNDLYVGDDLVVDRNSILKQVNATGLYVDGDVIINGSISADNLDSGTSSEEVEMILDVMDTPPVCDSSSQGLMYLDNSSDPQLGICYDSTWIYSSLSPPVA